jgi:hypothetical protein
MSGAGRSTLLSKSLWQKNGCVVYCLVSLGASITTFYFATGSKLDHLMIHEEKCDRTARSVRI